ncbi:AraC family transcriptional regulator [Dactylosporangium fulvum]|uniref:AraC family transcriptional regulator n=1 Tax=Dactylosporangium fulvum TaxID=53359 RepID=UPI0022275689|nr:AraC family transcriptional regulator [Dactylosporangium fulvum]
MSTPSLPLPPAGDPLGEALHLLHMTGTLYCRAECTAPWGVAVPHLDGVMTLQVVTAGEAWLEVDGEEPLLLRPGSMSLIPHGTPHRLRSDPDARADPLFDLPVEKVSGRYEILRHGGGGARTNVMYGVMEVDHVAARRLAGQLPAVLHLDSWNADDAGWLGSTLRFIAREAAELRPGGETVITRLADILVIQAIRAWLDSAPDARVGWLAALRDDQVGRALRSIHRAPERDWSVQSLAREAGMSRSAFAARFTTLVGESAMRYLTEWRLQLARAHLPRTTEPLSTTARRFGYQSEAAFSRAFKREFGISPGRLR